VEPGGNELTRAAREIGRDLARARERQALSLADLSRRTKISVPTLVSVERGDFRHLPGGIYTRGLLRACAREVGLDPEDLVRRWRESESAADAELMAHLVTVRETGGRVQPGQIDAADRRRHLGHQLAFWSALILGGGLYFVFSVYARPAMPVVIQPPSAFERSAEASRSEVSAAPERGSARLQPSVPVATAGTAPGMHTPGAIALDIVPLAECWVSAIADGERVLYQVLNAGERTHVDAKSDLVLRVGDPSACAVTINGAPARSLGDAGQAVTVHLTPQNVREFVTP
jgi:cytoskeleton protein RodZ